jgi:hypothetical protein
MAVTDATSARSVRAIPVDLSPGAERERPAAPLPRTSRSARPDPPRRSGESRAVARRQVAHLDRHARARIDRIDARGPGYAHDVTMSAADRAALPRDQASAVSRARTAYAGLIARGYQVVVTESQGNNGRPVVVIRPPGFDPNKPIDVHTHYHGDGGSAYGDGDPKTRQTRAIAEITAANPQSVWVLPVAGRGSNGNQWRPVNQARTTADALTGLSQVMHASNPDAPDLSVGSRTVSFHSAGHGALAASANVPGGLAADRVEVLDALTTASTNALESWMRGEGRGAIVSLHDTALGLQATRRRQSELISQLTAAGAVHASRDADHDALVYEHLQGDLIRRPGGR